MGDNKGAGLALRVNVVKGRDLAPKDKNGSSDPYLVLTLGDAKEATSVISKTLNPEWNQTFELPVLGVQSLLLEVVCWDKDRFGKDYMGEFDIALEDIFGNGEAAQEPKWYPLQSRRTGKKKSIATGEVLLKFAIYDPIHESATTQQILQKFYGMIASTPEMPDDDPDELNRLDGADIGSEADSGDETDTGDEMRTEKKAEKKKRHRLARLKRKTKMRAYEFSGLSDVAGVLFVEIQRITDLPPEKNMTRTSFDMDPFVVTSLGKKTYRTKVIRHNLNPVYEEKLVFQVLRHETNYSLSFTVIDRDKLSGNDFVGTANLPVATVKAFAPEADPDTGLYNLPELPDSTAMPSPDQRERKSRFRLPISRSSSTNNLKGMSRSSSATSLQRLPYRPGLKKEDSVNSLGGDTDLPSPPTSAPTSNPMQQNGGFNGYSSVYSNGSGNGNGSVSSFGVPMVKVDSETGDDEALKSYIIPLELKNKDRWEAKHSPILYIRAKYLPYQALRQQFWRAMLKHYDADDSGKLDKVELTTMLDTLGSTLHNSTIDSWFQRFAEYNDGEEILTMDQAVICLEDQLQKYRAKSFGDTIRGHLPHSVTSKMTNAGGKVARETPKNTAPLQSSNEDTPLNNQSHTSLIPTLEVSDLSQYNGEKGGALPDDDLADENDKQEEHVIEIRECPICHQPRLDKKNSEADIITHIATCASQDWRQVNNIVMAGFVTSSQAQRKWYSKVITKIGYGGYKLGANSANILVQDRTTGQINEERMSVYVRLGIRLLYKGLKSRDMEKKRIRKLLRSLSYKQGRKYDDPASVQQIQGFINFHQLDMSEVLRPTREFKNFNEFFYRELKPGARPCSAPDRPEIFTSPADCRTVVFNHLSEAQRIWVKGREFSVERLLGPAYPKDVDRFTGGALGIFRLAPQDYHRFHIPVDGVMGEPKLIEGEYYTVNPMAIRSALDVYGENVRVCVPIETEVFGRVMVICVGAMMVGSTIITRKTGERVRRAEELGYFKFGGSTLLLLFAPNTVRFDDDLVDNSNSALETLIRVGTSIGHATSSPAYMEDMKKVNPSQEEMQEAKRRIEGSLGPSRGSPTAADIR
ncbi:phosphatidylserine decarboxylase [Elasticomyces elasticus]|nr:phosphatidylserine decarboxylase [Elasticomyces elasticus]